MSTAILKTLGSQLLKGVGLFFLAIGYLVGFSIISIVSIGLCTSEEFSVLAKGRKRNPRFPIYKEHGQFHVQAQYVSMVGWMLMFVALVCLTG